MVPVQTRPFLPAAKVRRPPQPQKFNAITSTAKEKKNMDSLGLKEAKRRMRQAGRMKRRIKRKRPGRMKVKNKTGGKMKERGEIKKRARKRCRSKELCELSEEKEEKEVKIRRKLKAGSAGPDSISHTDLRLALVDSLFLLFIWTRVGRPTLMRCHHQPHMQSYCFALSRSSRGLVPRT